ncbi:hypothetical protein [Chryseobacterium sp.]|uniref:hypothetical protein n=1 Tax=Chryseobacterium sp. TaxID=1871047 RepID=UPI000EBEABC1|nr:hypothetical protein [Chryseobacterium sp.]HCA07413.1 hypothetical protein [Chryseobacterium sp.]
MKNLINGLDEFDEESQALLNAFTTDKTINFQNRPVTALQGIMTDQGSEDYRSPFHDYSGTSLGDSYLTDDPVSCFASTGANEAGKKGMNIMHRFFLVKQVLRFMEAIRLMKEKIRPYFCFTRNRIPKNQTFRVTSVLLKWEIIL